MSAFPQARARSSLTIIHQAHVRAQATGQPILATLAFACPGLDPLSLFAHSRTEPRDYWEQPTAGFALAGVGSVSELCLAGEDRFAQAAGWWQQRCATAVGAAPPDLPLALPLAVAGFAFAPQPPRAPHWQPFGSGVLTVPRWVALRWGAQSWLAISTLVRPADDPVALASQLEEELVWPSPSPPSPTSPPALLASSDDSPAWKEAARQAIAAIRRGATEKLVLAREVRLLAEHPFDLPAALAWLREAYPSCTLFAFTRQGATFLGATPERLVRLHERTVETLALAGSAPRGTTLPEDEALGRALLADPKERHEHALVVQALAEALRPLCFQLTLPDQPTLLRLPNVQHLATPLRGELVNGACLLDLLARLHPTPAVGGWPREAALAALPRCERFERGWYTGPVGWLAGDGSGEFVVALRSALVRGHEARLFAGCGLVAASDPTRELRETELKLLPMRRALFRSDR
ncbi:MAG: isochorismate synthase [Chloroflexi bacterium]|nr:isochorismate synthase [Chloroflexota bacterium]